MSETDDRGDADAGVSVVDPRLPRFGQAITATLLLAGVALQEAVPVYAVALILCTSVLSRWRLDLYALLWRGPLAPFVDRPAEFEPAAPHRFARLLGAGGSVVASVLLGLSLATAGFALAAFVGLLAGLGAGTGFCLGCRMYRGVSYARRLDLV